MTEQEWKQSKDRREFEGLIRDCKDPKMRVKFMGMMKQMDKMNSDAWETYGGKK